MQLVRLPAAPQAQVEAAFGVDPATVWRWDKALAGGGVAGLVPARRGPKGATKLTGQLAGRITGLDAQGMTLRQIAAATGVSTFTVRAALGRIPARGQDQAGESGSGGQPGPDARLSEPEEASGQDDGDDRQDEPLPVLPDPLPRGGERALSRFGLLGEGAQPLFKAGVRYPLAGLVRRHLEKQAMQAGLEFMRLLTQAHLDLRTAHERRRADVVDAEGTRALPARTGMSGPG